MNTQNEFAAIDAQRAEILKVYQELLTHLPVSFDMCLFDGSELQWMSIMCARLGMPEMMFRNIAKPLMNKKSNKWESLAGYFSQNWKECYSHYLQSKQWKNLRDYIMDRDFDRCVKCQQWAQEVHHNTYDNVGLEKPEDLISVCKRCHRQIHNLDDYEPLIPTYSHNRFQMPSFNIWDALSEPNPHDPYL